MERSRKISQTLFAVAANSYWSFLWKSPIFKGWSKRICCPGLNCYSCPAAVMACPIGGLQNFLASFRINLKLAEMQFGAYILGTLALIGSFVGRMPCGWLCPFGFVQEFLYRIPTPKISVGRWTRVGPYIFLGLFVIILPILVVDATGYGATWFCKYICPAGTVEAGLPLLGLHPELRRAAGWLFVNKLVVLVVILVWCVVTSRAFCRAICPLGAIYGLFNRISFLRLNFDQSKCVNCKACKTICPTSISFYNGEDQINSTACIRCMRCYSMCPVSAVSFSLGLYAGDLTNNEQQAGKAAGEKAA
ncbi:MAG: 4Fe-4S binding protein [Desulfobacteraceae bacterium]|nr:4Fe-4S binding protein [Desulfobacteraceae bacterium]